MFQLQVEKTFLALFKWINCRWDTLRHEFIRFRHYISSSYCTQSVHWTWKVHLWVHSQCNLHIHSGNTSALIAYNTPVHCYCTLNVGSASVSAITVYNACAAYFMKTWCVSAVCCVYCSYTPDGHIALLMYVVHTWSTLRLRYVRQQCLDVWNNCCIQQCSWTTMRFWHIAIQKIGDCSYFTAQQCAIEATLCACRNVQKDGRTVTATVSFPYTIPPRKYWTNEVTVVHLSLFTIFYFLDWTRNALFAIKSLNLICRFEITHLLNTCRACDLRMCLICVL